MIPLFCQIDLKLVQVSIIHNKELENNWHVTYHVSSSSSNFHPDTATFGVSVNIYNQAFYR